MTNAGLVLAKLTRLREYVDRMERRRATALDVFRSDVDRQDALALSLIVSLQEAADIALHVASDEGWGIASSYAASFDLIAQHGVIAADLADRLSAVSSLRNRIAHGYGAVDLERIWRETPTGVAALREFAAAIAAYIDMGPAARGNGAL